MEIKKKTFWTITLVLIGIIIIVALVSMGSLGNKEEFKPSEKIIEKPVQVETDSDNGFNNIAIDEFTESIRDFFPIAIGLTIAFTFLIMVMPLFRRSY